MVVIYNKLALMSWLVCSADCTLPILLLEKFVIAIFIQPILIGQVVGSSFVGVVASPFSSTDRTAPLAVTKESVLSVLVFVEVG